MEMYGSVLLAIVGTLMAILMSLFVIYGIIILVKQIKDELTGEKPEDDLLL